MRKKEIIKKLETVENIAVKSECKIEKLEEKNKKLNEIIIEQSQRIWKLENSFKFNLGDEVKIKENNELQIVYLDAIETTKKNEIIYLLFD